MWKNVLSNYFIKQLRYTGLVEAVRIRREGYSHRPSFADFIDSYAGLLSLPPRRTHSDRVTVVRILQCAGEKQGWCLGRHRVFMRYSLPNRLDAAMRCRYQAATLIQRRKRST